MGRISLFLRTVFVVVVLCYATTMVQLQAVLKAYVFSDVTTEDSVAPVEQQRALEAVREMQAAKKKKLKKLSKKAVALNKIAAGKGEAQPVEIVDTSEWAKPSGSYKIDKNDLWESMESLPKWMLNYFRWHKEQTSKDWSASVSKSLPKDKKFLYVSCLSSYKKCGGAADRLLSLPFFVKVAASTNRILLFQWTRPAKLEEFLLPPVSGFDWRVPKIKEAELQQVGERAGTQDTILAMGSKSTVHVLQVKFQSHDHGALYYDSIRESQDELDFTHVFASVWKVFFTPSPGLASKLDETLAQTGLVPGQYTAAHVRALYNTDAREKALVIQWSKNAVHCAVNLQQVTTKDDLLPVYFASDSKVATVQATLYGAAHGLHIASRSETVAKQREPLHLDKTADWKKRPATDFYDAFVDFYMMGLSKCVTYGMGGYGLFASLLTSDPKCSIVHMTATSAAKCDLPKGGIVRRRKGHRTAKKPVQKPNSSGQPVFLPSMTAIQADVEFKAARKKKTIVKKAKSLVAAIAAKPKTPEEIPTAAADASIKTTKALAQSSNKEEGRRLERRTHDDLPTYPDPNAMSFALWEDSEVLPQWTKDYFAWHAQQRKLLTEDNVHDFKFIVMACLRKSPHCGGTADRLRSVPFMVRAAAESKRILLIKWEKPAPLEEFLLPPAGGMDWRTPDWMVSKLRTNGVRAVSNEKLVHFAAGPETFVKAHVQAHDHGSKYYNEQAAKNNEGDDAFRHHYHDIWYTLFTPVPAIATAVTQEMERMHLVPGEYAFAHVRSAYGIEETGGRDNETVKKWTENALNCISSLRPGGPYFFSSDSAYAKQVAVEYGRQKNVPVVTRLDDKQDDPLHLDLAPDWETRPVSDFYPVFLDLYLMSLGRCYSYNMGGYSKWANLISGHDFKCNVRHWTAGVDKKSADKDGCPWTEPTTADRRQTTAAEKLDGPLFLSPMKD